MEYMKEHFGKTNKNSTYKKSYARTFCCFFLKLC